MTQHNTTIRRWGVQCALQANLTRALMIVDQLRGHPNKTLIHSFWDGYRSTTESMDAFEQASLSS